MCSGIRVPLRETGLFSWWLWNDFPFLQNFVLVVLPWKWCSFSEYAVSYSLFGNPKPLYMALIQWISARDYCIPRGVSGNVWRCFWLPHKGGAIGIQWVRTQVLQNILRCTREAPTTKNYSAQMSVVGGLRTSALTLIILYCNLSLARAYTLLAFTSFTGQEIVFCLLKYILYMVHVHEHWMLNDSQMLSLTVVVTYLYFLSTYCEVWKSLFKL